MNDENTFNLDDTRKRLQEWGEWCHFILTMGLNYSSKSLIAQLQDAKGMLISDTSGKICPKNDNAEEIDELVNCYAKENPKKARVLSIHYVDEGEVKKRIERSNLPKHTYYRYLLCAEKWINKYL